MASRLTGTGLRRRTARRRKGSLFALACPVPLYSLKIRALFGHLLEPEPPESGQPDPAVPGDHGQNPPAISRITS